MSIRRRWLRVGDKVLRKPIAPREKTEATTQTGTVVFVHPCGRFHVVEFEGIHGPFRESFRGC